MEITEGMSEKGLLLLNGDDVMLRHLDKEPVQRVTYFGQSEGCDIRGYGVEQDGEILRFRTEAGRLDIPVEMAMEGEHFVNDALAAVAVGLKMQIAPVKIAESLGNFQNIYALLYGHINISLIP
jgi:UDP-N-acetylmuramoyl-tripeptide--D-alanyl-D-alanine ligase